jgi:hypothetical protein
MPDAEAAAASRSPGQHAGAQARTDGQKRRRGAEVGNQRAWRHGRRSAGAVQRRKAGAAGRKAAGLILARLNLLGDYRHRPRALRPDQLPHLGAEAVAMLQRLGVIGA